MDDSIYNALQSQMIVNLTTSSNSNDIPVSYGPVLYDVLASIASKIGGIEYLIGASRILSKCVQSLTDWTRSIANHER